MVANEQIQQESRSYEIKPTGQSVADQYSDIALTNLYSAAANQFITEGQLIWSRFNAMLVANSIIFILAGPSIRDLQSTSNLLLMLGTGVFGLLISIVWLQLSYRSIQLQRYWRDCAMGFSWQQGFPNPTTYIYERWEKEKKKSVGKYLVLGKLGLFVIWMFIAAHSVIIIVAIIWLLPRCS